MNSRQPLPPGSSRRSPIFVLIGGFLGAGKTTCMVAFSQWLTTQGFRIGLVTNDQADGLIDTVLAEDKAADAVRQVTGGCFCCQADELGRVLKELEVEKRPDVFVAEPVGSCTDLVATILLPLKQIYDGNLQPAPMSVVVDSRRFYDMLLKKSNASKSRGFGRDVRYIYLKQLEEAEIVVLNKEDLLNDSEKKRLEKKFVLDWPSKKLFWVSAKTGRGLEEWFALLISGQISQTDKLLEIDYEQYANGEAKLGWFNAKLTMHQDPWIIDPNSFLETLARNIQKALEKRNIEIAHFKMSFLADANDDFPEAKLAVVNAVRNGSQAELSRRMKGKVKSGEILINLRAESPPEALNEIIRHEIKDLPLQWENASAFSPSKPIPVHRILVLN